MSFEPGQDPGQGPVAGGEEEPAAELIDDSQSIADDPFDNMGSELFDDAPVNPDEPAATATPATPATPAPGFDPTKVDILRLDLNTVPVAERPYWASQQALARNLQGGTEKTVQQMNEMMAKMEGLLPKTPEQNTDLPALPDGVGTFTSQTGYLPEQTWNALGQEDRQGLSFFLTAAQNMFAPYLRAVMDLPALKESVTGITSKADQEVQAAIGAEFDRLQTDYPGEDTAAWLQTVGQQMALRNPTTNTYYTADEAYRLLTGKAQKSAQDMAAAALAHRNGAKAGLAPRTGAAPSAEAPAGAATSEADGQAEVARALGLRA